MEVPGLMQHYAKEGTYHGEKAVLLKHGPYSAVILPRLGGNLIAFRDDDRGWSFLRKPSEQEFDEFVQSPKVHGIPVLVPPNRYDGGRFSWGGRNYAFPVNEPATGNHLHGFAADSEWTVAGFGSDEGKSWVKVTLKFDETHPAYAYFPHTFTLANTYELSGDGLTQHFEAVNEGGEAMPFMLGFHTAVNAPFAPGSTREDIAVRVTIGERWELDGRMLPTGKKLALSEGEARLAAGEGDPYFEELDNHYTAAPQGGRNFAEIVDRKAGVRFVYDAGLKYKHWMIWNNKANGRFFCPEPQTNMVNAPNMDLPVEETGVITLQPGESWSETSRLYVESL
jgi:aldose 1-epimerase